MNINKIADALYKSDLSYGKILSAFIRGWMLVLALLLLFSLITMAYIYFFDTRYIAVARINEAYSENIDIKTFLIDLKDSRNFSDEVQKICTNKGKLLKFKAIINTLAVEKIANKKFKLTLNLNGAHSDAIEKCSQAIFFSVKDLFIKYYKNEISENLINIKDLNIITKDLVDNSNLTNDPKNLLKLSYVDKISDDILKFYKINLHLNSTINKISISDVDITIDGVNYTKYFSLSLIFGLFISLFIVAYKEILITLDLFFRNL